MSETHGIKKVSENILAPGRAIIVTEKDKDKYTWGEIPDGSIFIDTETGIEAVKLKGESDWVPAHVKNDGTISIAKDNINKVESFTVVQEDVPGNPDEFIYTNSEGQQRHGIKEWNAAKTVLKGYVFTLEQGTYIMHRNHLKVTIDDVLHRSVATGGVEEISEKRFRLTEKLVDKMEITVEYSAAFRMGCPYPRFFMNGEVPEASEVGDFWLDTDASLDEEGPADDIEGNKMIGWDRIQNHPTSIAGYGITDKISMQGHVHSINDIVGMPTKLPANGGHADTADTAIRAGTTKRAESASLSDMAINDGANRNIVATYLTKDGEGATGTWPIDIAGEAYSARKADCDSYGRIIADTYLTPNGGTLKGALGFGNNIWNPVGDDAYFGDINQDGCFAIRGQNGTTGLAFARRSDDSDVATMKYDGGAIEVSKPLKADLLGNAVSASSVNWEDIIHRPETMPAGGGTADIAHTAEKIYNGVSDMSFSWMDNGTQPIYVLGASDSSHAYIYGTGSLSVGHAETAGNAETFEGRRTGEAPGDVPVIQEDGKLADSVLPVASGSPVPPKERENAIWFDTESMSIKVFKDGAWRIFGAAYQ